MPETQDWALPQLTPVTLLAGQSITCNESGATTTLLLGVAGHSWVVVGFTITPDPSQVAALAIRDWVTLWLVSGTSLAILGRVGMGPPAPFAQAVIPFGQAQAGAAEAVKVLAYTAPGSGQCAILGDLIYYQV